MSAPKPLLPSDVRQICDPAVFEFSTTADIDPLDEVIGQERAVHAIDFGLPGDEWIELSGMLRREHELTHYELHRLRGAITRNLAEEVIADFEALLATGRPEAWLPLLLGLDLELEKARFTHYLPPSLAGHAESFRKMLERAASTLAAQQLGEMTPRDRLMALGQQSLESLVLGNWSPGSIHNAA